MQGVIMRTGMILACFFIAFLSQPALSDDFDDFGNQITYFYLSPSQSQFDAFQSNADKFQDILDSSENSASLLVAVMIARISQKYNWPIGSGVLGQRAKEIVEGKSQVARYVSDDSLIDPTKLDIWWASFFATGDEYYLERIFQYAGLALPKGDSEMMLVIGAATWSFRSNCRQHKMVLEFARKKQNLPSLPEAQVRFIEDCIAHAESNGIGQSTPDDNP